MSRIKRIASGAMVLSWLTLAGCATNSRIPEIREASFNRSAATSAPAASGVPYEVQQGDTLYSIAWRYNTDYHDLAHWNDIKPPYALHVGQKLRVSAPNITSSPEAVQVKPLQSHDNASAPAENGDESWLISTPTHSTANATQTVTAPQAEANKSAPAPDAGSDNNVAPPAAINRDNIPEADSKLPEKAPVAPAAEKNVAPSATVSPSDGASKNIDTSWIWPTKGAVVRHFSDPSPITAGVDIAGQKGQIVVASRSGTVVYADNSVRGYGNLVIIKHDAHFLSAYAHNDTLKVKVNETVKAGQAIATLGDTEADRSMLHFEIRQDGQAKDPQQFLPRS